MKNIKFITMTIFLISNLAFAEGDHDHSSHKGHDHSKQEEKHDDHDDHKGHDHSKHDDHDDHSKHSDNKGHDHGASKAIGKGRAIEIVDEKKGFKLSKEAIKTLKLRLQNVDGDQFEISKATLVSSKSIKGVYRFRAGFFKLLSAKILKETKSGYKVKVAGVEFGDQIVINGVGLLRVTDVYSTDKSEYGHSH
ncbi:MAG: hypothetical protein CL677_04730 [Bdellovibrionaceae bacterium]|mgnify:CR=1 FL=1|nr:hypothetical protein [Pseudobdellovibrionaceae bacterium]|tara:strand:- start:90524 stop:91102 length:579 start_codon:yes stop_codon:yes gene_type:complete